MAIERGSIAESAASVERTGDDTSRRVASSAFRRGPRFAERNAAVWLWLPPLPEASTCGLMLQLQPAGLGRKVPRLATNFAGAGSHGYAGPTMRHAQRRRPSRGRAVSIENDHRVTVLPGGGHIAEVHDKATGVNPLWVPPWTSIEPLTVRRRPASRLRRRRGRAGCWPASPATTSASTSSAARRKTRRAPACPCTARRRSVDYDVRGSGGALTARARLPLAGLDVERELELRGRAVWIRETVRNTGGVDRPIGWTQHVTLGPPFLEKGRTEFRASMTRSRVFESAFGAARLSDGRCRLRLAERAAASAGAQPICAGFHRRRRPAPIRLT